MTRNREGELKIMKNNDHDIIIMNLHMRAPQLKKSDLPIQTAGLAAAMNALRTNFYDWSLPWKESGDRLTTVWAFPYFWEEHKALRHGLVAAQAQFMDSYLSALDQREFESVETQLDYPNAEEVMSQFHLSHVMDTISTPLQPGESTIVEPFPELMDQRFADADKALRAKLTRPLEHFIAAMGRGKYMFGSCLVNLQRALATANLLNFSKNTEFEECCSELNELLTPLSISQLRADASLRLDVGSASAAIMERLTAGHSS